MNRNLTANPPLCKCGKPCRLPTFAQARRRRWPWPSKKKSNYVDTDMQKNDNEEMVRNYLIPKEKAGYVTYSTYESSPQRSPGKLRNAS
jgi:hypothetical protein